MDCALNQLGYIYFTLIPREDAMLRDFLGWFDVKSAATTLLVSPLIIYIVLLIRRHVWRIVRYVIEGLFFELLRILAHTAAARLTFKRYCRIQLAGTSRYLHVPGISDTSLDIDEIFIPLELENAAATNRYNCQTLLHAGLRLRVIGDPGSGKSTLIKRLYRDECLRALSAPRKCRFPILIELRKISAPRSLQVEQRGQWLLDVLKSEVALTKVYDIHTCFEAYASSSGLLVLLDGLDEVPSSQFEQIQDAINQLSSLLQGLGENNALVLTMRTQFHQQVRHLFVDQLPISLSLKRFSSSDIYEFLRRWRYKRGETDDNAIRIFTDLTDRPALREMCTNPLILSMYVARDQTDSGALIPDSRTDFYNQVIDELLIRRRARQIGAAETQTVVRTQRQRILGRIAIDHLLSSDQALNVIPWKEAVSVVTQETGLNAPEASHYLRELSKDTGLLAEERQGEQLRFMHLTFCEFFAAFETVQGRTDGWSTLVETHKRFKEQAPLHSRLLEVIPFACALMPRHMRASALDAVAEIGDMHLLALAFLETKAYDHASWQLFTDRIKAALLKLADTDWDSRWLNELHLFLVTISDFDRAAAVLPLCKTEENLAAFFQELAKNSKAPLSSLLLKYAEQDAVAAFRVADLCGIDVVTQIPQAVVANCDQPPFLAVALERASREFDRPDAWANLFSEAGLRYPIVASMLHRRSDERWSELSAQRPKSMHWHYRSVLPETLFTNFLTIAVTSSQICEVNTPLLSKLRTLPPPTQNWILRNSMMFSSLLALVGFFVGYGLAVSGSMFFDRLRAHMTDISIFFGWFVVSALTFLYFLRANMLLSCYRTVMWYLVPTVLFSTIFLPFAMAAVSSEKWAFWFWLNPFRIRAGSKLKSLRLMIVRRGFYPRALQKGLLPTNFWHAFVDFVTTRDQLTL